MEQPQRIAELLTALIATQPLGADPLTRRLNRQRRQRERDAAKFASYRSAERAKVRAICKAKGSTNVNDW